MTFAAAGAWQNSSVAALGLSNQGVGNLLVVAVLNWANSTVWATGLTGGGATWVQAGVKYSGAAATGTAAVFLGTVTAAGAQTATPTWSGTIPGGYELTGHEFTSTAGSWVFDKQGNLDSSGTANWPSLAPAFGAGELYFGFAVNGGSAAAGSTSGYTYLAAAGAGSDGAAFNPACGAGATFPVWGDAAQQIGVMVLVAEAAAGTDTSPAWAASQGTLGGGAGSWTNPGNATGAADSSYATWTAP